MSVLSQCLPRIVQVTPYGTLTKESVRGMTPQDIEDFRTRGLSEAADVYGNMTLGRLCGVRESILVDVLLHSVKGIKGELTKQSIGPNKSYFLPYILRQHKDIVNQNYFTVVSGAAVGGGHPGRWVIRVTATPSQWVSDVPSLERYFLNLEGITVLNLGAAGQSQTINLKVVSAVNDDIGNQKGALVTVDPYFTNAGWNALTPAQQAPFHPTNGVALNILSNISNYAHYCHNQPVNNSVRVKAYWPSTFRFTWTWDDLQKDYLEKIFSGKVNPYLQKFQELPLVEQNRAAFTEYRKKWLNTIFYGDRIDENQTVEGYQALPRVVDPNPNSAGSFIEYETQMIGIRPQLANCGRIFDMRGAALDVNQLENILYTIKRHREVNMVGSVTEISAMTNRATANQFKSLMARVYKRKYDMEWNRYYRADEPLVYDSNVLWSRVSYEFEDIDIMFTVYVENYFTDHKENFSAAQASRGNSLWILDFSDFNYGVFKTRARETNDPDPTTNPDYRCRIDSVITHHELRSETATFIIGNENRHAIIENFSNECPEYEITFCEPTTAS